MHHLYGVRSATIAIAALTLTAGCGEKDDTSDDTDTQVDTFGTGITESFFEPVGFSYFIQMGVNQDGEISRFSVRDNGGNTQEFRTGVFVTLVDRRDNECTFGYLYPEGGGTDTDTDAGSGPDADLLAWLDARDFVQGFRIQDGNYDSADPDCDLDPNAFGGDVQAFFISNGTIDSMLVGVLDGLTADDRDLLEGVDNLEPDISYYFSGAMQQALTITRTDPDTGAQTQSNDIDVIGNAYPVNDDMLADLDGNIAASEIGRGGSWTPGVYLMFSLGTIGLQ